MRYLRTILLKSIRYVGVAIVIGLAVIYRHELKDALLLGLEAGPVVLLLLPLFFVWNYVAAWGWRTLIRSIDSKTVISTLRLSLLRWSAQAVNLVLPFSVGAPVAKTALLSGIDVDKARSATTVALDMIASTTAGMIFTVLGISLYFSELQLAGSAVLFLGAIVTLLSLLFYQAPWFAKTFLKVKRFSSNSVLGSILQKLSNAGSNLRRSLLFCLISHLIEQSLMALEIFIISYALGVPLAPAELIFVAAMLSGFTTLFFFIPGHLGASEGAIVLAFSTMGLSPEVGLSVGLIRRARQLIVYGAGMVWLFTFGGFGAFKTKANHQSISVSNSKRNGGKQNENFVHTAG